MTRAKPQAVGHERRRHPRNAVIWSGELIADGCATPCVILDLSASGVKLQLGAKREIAEPRVMVRVPRFGDFHGEVVWYRDTRLGVRLKEDPARIAGILHAVLGAAAAPGEEADDDAARP